MNGSRWVIMLTRGTTPRDCAAPSLLMAMVGGSLSGACREVRGVAVADDRNLLEGVANLPEVVGAQRDLRGGGVLLHPRRLRRARDRYDPGLLREQPRERDLRGRRL